MHDSPAPPLTPLRLLFFSPEPLSAEALEQRFRQGGFAVEFACHESLAPALPGIQAFDLALLDSRWPQLLPQLQQHAPELPVVAVHDGPEEDGIHLRWLRDGALECLFAKDEPRLAAVA